MEVGETELGTGMETMCVRWVEAGLWWNFSMVEGVVVYMLSVPFGRVLMSRLFGVVGFGRGRGRMVSVERSQRRRWEGQVAKM